MAGAELSTPATAHRQEDRPALREIAGGAARGRGRFPAQRLLEGRGWLLLRLGTDVAMLLLAVAAARLGASAADMSSEGQRLIWIFPPVALALLAVRGLYGRKLHVRVLDGVGHVVGATSVAAMSIIAAAILITPDLRPGPLLVRTWFFATAYVASGRVLLALTQRRARTNRVVAKPALIVGAGQVGCQVERRLEEQPELGLHPVGYLDADPPPDERVPARQAPVLGAPWDLGRVADQVGAEHVVFAFLSAPDHILIPLVRECEARGLEMSLVPRLFDSINERMALEHIGGLPLFGLRAVDPKGWQFAMKHAFDRVAAPLLIALTAPVLLAAAVAVKLSSPGPIFFRQPRIGRDGREFDILKFRSMGLPETGEGPTGGAVGATDDPADGQVPAATNGSSADTSADTAPGGVEGVDRRTRVGTLLRRTSLDELPQLFNVLRGEMSIVGPRPERPEFAERFGESVRRYTDRHRVRSGITGWAQVHGLRGQTSLSDRVEWDNYYIQNWSLALDLRILAMTVAAVFRSAPE